MTTPDEAIREIDLKASQRTPRITFRDDFDSNLSKWYVPPIFPIPTISDSMVHLDTVDRVQAIIAKIAGARNWSNYTTRARLRGANLELYSQGFGFGTYANKDTLDGYLLQFRHAWFDVIAVVLGVGHLIHSDQYENFGLPVLENNVWFEASIKVQLEETETGPKNCITVVMNNVTIFNDYAPTDYFFTSGAPGIVKQVDTTVDCDWIEVPSF